VIATVSPGLANETSGTSKQIERPGTLAKNVEIGLAPSLRVE
jgi:hypothetical protein